LYVRADMRNETVARLAYLMHPHIIVHNEGEEGTLRQACVKLSIPSITVEIGNPQVFQRDLIERAITGVRNILDYLEVMPSTAKTVTFEAPVLCERSFWQYTTVGGLLDVVPRAGSRIRAGDVLATVSDIFGAVTAVYRSSSDAVVVGLSSNPSNHQGDRIAHLGIVAARQLPSTLFSPALVPASFRSTQCALEVKPAPAPAATTAIGNHEPPRSK